MKFWCEGIPNYTSLEKQRFVEWQKLNEKNKIKLKTYSHLIDSNKFSLKNESHRALMEYVIKNKLCTTMVPLSELDHGKKIEEKSKQEIAKSKTLESV